MGFVERGAEAAWLCALALRKEAEVSEGIGGSDWCRLGDRVAFIAWDSAPNFEAEDKSTDVFKASSIRFYYGSSRFLPPKMSGSII
ncbi:hypothetical protein OIU76_006650 [Salix suchowensis]|nr:hypothetical protein OIU76_006650 [Salix suchowensis]